jgi:hypothetical protein
VVNAGKTAGTVTPTVADFVVEDDSTNFLIGTLYNAPGGNDSLVNGAYSVILGNTGTVTLPSGGTISEGYVTSNPTIQLTPASPDVASQKLVIKGGGGQYYNLENGIDLGTNNNVWAVSDSATFYVYAPTRPNETLYWWIVPEEGGISTTMSGIVELGSEGEGVFNFTVISDAYEFRVRVSPEEDNYDPESIGVESVLMNGDAPTFGSDYHLHLTTGDLSETSIFLGTDDHNVRTTTDGKIQITTPSEGNNVWEFGTDGSLTFPDATVQTTAFTGTIAYSNVIGAPTTSSTSTSTLVNGSYSLSLSSNGVLTLPNNLTIDSSASTATIAATNTSSLSISARDITISAAIPTFGNTGDPTGDPAPQWQFGVDGTTTLPSGVQISNNFYQNNMFVLGADSVRGINLYTNDSHGITVRGSASGQSTATTAVIITANGASTYDYQNWNFKADGTTEFPHRVRFTTSSFILPEAGKIVQPPLVIGPVYDSQPDPTSGFIFVNKDTAPINRPYSSLDQYIFPGTSMIASNGSSTSVISISSTGILDEYLNETYTITVDATWLTNNYGTGAFTFDIYDGGTWTFGTDASLTFPDNTVQTTAYSPASSSWTVTTGTNTYSFTVPMDGTYVMWVKGNIPNGIITWNATVSVSNTNVPAIGQQYAWNYTGGGSPILLTAIPDQIRGTAGTISTDATYAGTTSNRFDFTIANTSGASQTVYYGYTKV